MPGILRKLHRFDFLLSASSHWQQLACRVSKIMKWLWRGASEKIKCVVEVKTVISVGQPYNAGFYQCCAYMALQDIPFGIYTDHKTFQFIRMDESRTLHHTQLYDLMQSEYDCFNSSAVAVYAHLFEIMGVPRSRPAPLHRQPLGWNGPLVWLHASKSVWLCAATSTAVKACLLSPTLRWWTCERWCHARSVCWRRCKCTIFCVFGHANSWA